MQRMYIYQQQIFKGEPPVVSTCQFLKEASQENAYLIRVLLWLRALPAFHQVGIPPSCAVRKALVTQWPGGHLEGVGWLELVLGSIPCCGMRCWACSSFRPLLQVCISMQRDAGLSWPKKDFILIKQKKNQYFSSFLEKIEQNYFKNPK